MSPRAPKGPRPQRVELDDALDDLVEAGVSELSGLARVGAELVRPALREYTLRLLELVGADSAGVTLRTEAGPPRVTKVRRPGHGEDV